MSANNFLYGNGKERLLGTSSSINLDDAETIATSKAVYELNKKIESTGKLPLGYFFLHPFPTPPDGCLVVNGGEYNRELYKDLWADVQIKGQYKTEVEWQSIAAANGGYCPWYSDGDGTTTFRTPKFAPYQKIALASGDAGKYYEAGLPNIEGRTGATSDTNLYLSGCCYAAAAGNRIGVYNTSSTSNKALALNASLFNPIYGNSTTVQPESHNWIVCAVAFGTTTNVGSVDVANVISAVGQVQAEVATKLEGSTVHIVETWKSEDGTIQCRKWSDGLIEQWGIQTNTGSVNAMIVTLPWEFSDTNYHIIVSGKTNTPNIACGISGVIISNNSFYAITDNHGYQSFWFVRGY